MYSYPRTLLWLENIQYSIQFKSTILKRAPSHHAYMWPVPYPLLSCEVVNDNRELLATELNCVAAIHM